MTPSEQRLFELLESRLQPNADITSIDAKIEELFSEQWAILITDMSGFSRRTARYGIIHFLAMIHTLKQMAEPLLIEYNGLLVKVVADSFFVLFRSPINAINFSLALREATVRYNTGKEVDAQIHVCQGLGYGRVLRIGEADVFGHEVNLAARLGEDTAHAGEILLSEQATQALTHLPNLTFEPREGELFGAGPIPYFSVKF